MQVISVCDKSKYVTIDIKSNVSHVKRLEKYLQSAIKKYRDRTKQQLSADHI